ncbi:MAG TPA: HprK-related kinase A [Telluria sp.]|nr:HprK-related kinase A [Telluria sp.]
MLTVASLTQHELARELAGPGIVLRTGAFASRIRTPIRHVAEDIGLLYADYPIEGGDGFADFHINLRQPGGLRRWFRPQVRFDHDGVAPFKPLPVGQAYPMLEWVLNWCVSSRANRYLIVHAAVLERAGGGAVVMPAPPGSGKSTLCAALVASGWRLLSDELALVRLEDGALLPLPRPVSLKNRSIGVIREFAPHMVMNRPVRDTSKGTVAHMKAPQDSVQRAGQAARAAWIVFPKYRAGAVTRLTPLPQARAFMRVAENAFNYSLLGQRGFCALADLIDDSSSFEFTYSDLAEAIDAFAALPHPMR